MQIYFTVFDASGNLRLHTDDLASAYTCFNYWLACGDAASLIAEPSWHK